jgi:hypothetical protein
MKISIIYKVVNGLLKCYMEKQCANSLFFGLSNRLNFDGNTRRPVKFCLNFYLSSYYRMFFQILHLSFGRRPIMLSCFVVLIMGSIGVAFGPQKSIGNLASYIVYTLSRFSIALGTRGIFVTGFVLGWNRNFNVISKYLIK